MAVCELMPPWVGTEGSAGGWCQSTRERWKGLGDNVMPQEGTRPS